MTSQQAQAIRLLEMATGQARAGQLVLAAARAADAADILRRERQRVARQAKGDVKRG